MSVFVVNRVLINNILFSGWSVRTLMGAGFWYGGNFRKYKTHLSASSVGIQFEEQ